MPKVTYLFGAGASCQCLPLVEQIPSRLADLALFIRGNRDTINGSQLVFQFAPIDIRNAEEELMQQCAELAQKSLVHASIDTYAKKLLITEPENNPRKYNVLKTILSLSFIYDQLRLKPDQRYDTFFASTLGKTHKDLNHSIRILSWNYDFQFEIAYSAYSLKDSLEEN